MSEAEVKELIGESSWPAFCKWMRGQTVGLNDDGSTNYYECDVQSFHAYNKRGKTAPIYD